ncbi:MAG: pyridoxamine 5'-phosphate oxidase family protein [Bacteroidota bacterium]
MSSYPIHSRNKVKRVPRNAHYDRATIYEILDAGNLCHLGFSVEGQPFVIPTIYGRIGDRLYLHGASKSRLIKHGEGGHPICVTVTHLDGLVLARSAFHHSMNYRSAVLFGVAKPVGAADKMRALRAISEQLLPGRWEESRLPNAIELKATGILELEIEQASAKIRTGPPVDDAADCALPIWAGVVPLRQQLGTPIPDEALSPNIPFPQSLRDLGYC